MKKAPTNIIVIEESQLQDIVIKAVSEALEVLTRKSECNDFEWVSNDKAAVLLSVSKRQLKYYRDKGYLPYSQLNRKIYYKLADIDEFLNQNYNAENDE